ncbi:UNVERIFIED_CONTAM: hypothetical protein Sangu_2564300 [Sesamum angustifolium]|uniref:Reverse transcriptase zinc-binding domain-containing protein n=1 Tax=Sesamum angustifolium TaxID=2727405 RepID=A0AAW2J7S9_9LAMI
MLGGQLIETRDLLEAASRWSVGYGTRIRIMEDRWLLCPMTFRPMTSIAQWRSGTTVNCLMIVGGEAWDEDLVRSLFPQFEANLHINLIGNSNLLGDKVTGCASLLKPPDWNFIWSTRTLPKLQLFAWRLCRRALPTIANLRKRGMKVTRGYPFCHEEEETMEHFLLRCPFSRQVWTIANFPWSEVSNFVGREEDWLRLLNMKLGKENLVWF